jgi:hypothetical protein
VTLEARRSPLLLLLRLLLLLLWLLLVPLGVITPIRWWWWRDRRTDAPLRAPWARELASSAQPIVLWRFWGAPKRATRQRDAACIASPPPTPPGAT